MPSIDRRRFLQGAAGAATAIAVGGPFQGFTAMAANAKGRDRQNTLRAIPDLRDGKVRLWLPEKFQYRSFHDTDLPAGSFVTLDDGTTLPGRHDGMGAFPLANGNVMLVRNHEINGSLPAFGPGTPYDSRAGSGTTSVEVTLHGEVVRSFTSLNGTQMNCSGGIMPWGSWVTCEETVNGPDVGPDFTGASNITLEKRHGFIFEVPAGGQSNRQPVTAAGRFAHEAVAFDPRDGILYLTEDNFGFPSGFYRYVPSSNPMRTGTLGNDGQLQMLAVVGRPNIHLEAAGVAGTTYDVEWVDIADPNPTFPYTPGQPAPTTNNDAISYVGNQGRAQGAAHFSRLEGAVYDRGVVYWTSTQGGGIAEAGSDTVGGYGNGHGQVWAFDPRAQQLMLVYQSPGPDVLDFPDNVTTSPRGTLIVCEDNTNDNYLRGLSRKGELFDVALNRLVSITGADRSGDEFAGSTFSPGGQTLFVNIQASRGITLAIWGPWGRVGV
jgi:secreted PhoX family phosphatase